ncbi:MAG TPA: BTAD domain-containing putative transcriptional regulator [Micromonosporaceae bacterium]|nr:BTAD domain-containing putative transcriptional regulator [Micromonosporaceae bacterium]
MRGGRDGWPSRTGRGTGTGSRPSRVATALYRDGRQGDALAVYRRLRRTLCDELGLDVGGEVR